MAPTKLGRLGTPHPIAIGSPIWVQNENHQTLVLMKEHMEDFYYSTVEAFYLLNEHMGQIFSENPVNMADLFKTPRKLHRKTPGTARRVFAHPRSPRGYNASPARPPLTNIFASKMLSQPSSQKTPPPPKEDLDFWFANEMPHENLMTNGLTALADADAVEIDQKKPAAHLSNQQSQTKSTITTQDDDVEMGMDQDVAETSDASSPEKPLRKKRSFSFAALPAREPLTAKRVRTEDKILPPPTPTQEPRNTKVKQPEEEEIVPAKPTQPYVQPDVPPDVQPEENKDDTAPPPPPKTTAPGKLVKPTKEPQQAAKPASVFVRVASQIQRIGQNLTKSQAEAAAPAPAPAASENNKVKALDAAARKKEIDARAAEARAEKRREIERKHAARQEEDRREEEERKAKLAKERAARQEAERKRAARAEERLRINEEKKQKKREAEEKAVQENAAREAARAERDAARAQREAERVEKDKELFRMRAARLERERAQKEAEERKRAAMPEEERREHDEMKASLDRLIKQKREESKAKEAAEKQAAEEERKAAEKQAAAKDEAKKASDREQMRKADELMDATKRELAQEAAEAKHPRGDVGGTLRHLTKNTVPEPAQAPVRAAVQTNAAKPPSRQYQPVDDSTSVWAPDDENTSLQIVQPQRPGLQRAANSYQQHEAARKRTLEVEREPVERHSVMAPPKRPSNLTRKDNHLPAGGVRDGTKYAPESTLAKLPHGYTQAPATATGNQHAIKHHAGNHPLSNHLGPNPYVVSHQSTNQHAANRPGNMYKATAATQAALQPPKPGLPAHPSQTVQVSNARIPFAENVNPPATAQYHGQTHAGSENVQPGPTQQKYKTPARPQNLASSLISRSTAKSSPTFMLGDNISLPEIHTDSEDEDSDDDNRFTVPDWAKSPALNAALMAQQTVDPETVFGPMKELDMDAMFKHSKNTDRLRRLRDRGSSALWVESGDAITSAEKRRDRELRERVVRDGGWTYEPNV